MGLLSNVPHTRPFQAQEEVYFFHTPHATTRRKEQRRWAFCSNSICMKGYVHIYTGDGKGKTTAAVGLAVRAAGAGLPVLLIHFLKGLPSSEDKMLSQMEQVFIQKYGCGQFITATPTPADREQAHQGWLAAQHEIMNGRYALVILDEITTVINLGLIDEDQALDLIKNRPAAVEFVLTGRDASPALVAAADLVTEMRAVKHYYEQGVRCRQGIEW